MIDKTVSCNNVQSFVTKKDAILRHLSLDKQNFVFKPHLQVFLFVSLAMWLKDFTVCAGSNGATPKWRSLSTSFQVTDAPATSLCIMLC